MELNGTIQMLRFLSVCEKNFLSNVKRLLLMFIVYFTLVCFPSKM